MKLLNIVPIFEDSENNPFTDRELPTEHHELIAALTRKEAAASHLYSKLFKMHGRFVKNIPGAITSWTYNKTVPGNNLGKDLASGKIIALFNTIVPNTPANQPSIQRAKELEKRIDAASKLGTKLKGKITRLTQLYTHNQLSAQKVGKDSRQHLEMNVPKKIPTGKNAAGALTSMPNPYFNGKDKRYAGDPAFYDWPYPKFAIECVRLNNLLTSNGFEGFTTLYASLNDTSRRYSIAVIGAKGQFIWWLRNAGPLAVTTALRNRIIVNAGLTQSTRACTSTQTAFIKTTSNLKK